MSDYIGAERDGARAFELHTDIHHGFYDQSDFHKQPPMSGWEVELHSLENREDETPCE